jgi:hypothetical protein
MKQYIFTEEEMIFNNEGEVTGATVEALIRNLTLHEKQAGKKHMNKTKLSEY